MFLGHFALALAAKRVAPRTSLGTTLLAANLADEVWPVLLLAGVEQVKIVPRLLAASPFDFVHYPWSHSLATLTLAGLVVGALYYALRRYSIGAVTVGVLVVSHFLLDLFFHRPDLPLWPDAHKVGLGLWSSVPITLICEAVVFAGGLWIYARATQARDRAGTILLWTFAGFLALTYGATLFGPPPQSVTALAWGGLVGWLIPLWGYFIDRHRTSNADRS